MHNTVSIRNNGGNPTPAEAGGEVYRYVIESERVFVQDDHGYTEVFDHKLVWHNRHIYLWTNSAMIDNCMCHFFDLVSPE
jgi:hypothetical protein